jgi:hypothetical protein
MIAAKPDIGLLGNGRVEEPGFPLLSLKLRKGSRVAIQLTKCICDGVFGLEMKDIDAEANIAEECILFHHLCKRAVVIKEYVTWFQVVSESTLYHFLLQFKSNVRIME